MRLHTVRCGVPPDHEPVRTDDEDRLDPKRSIAPRNLAVYTETSQERKTQFAGVEHNLAPLAVLGEAEYAARARHAPQDLVVDLQEVGSCWIPFRRKESNERR